MAARRPHSMVGSSAALQGASLAYGRTLHMGGHGGSTLPAANPSTGANPGSSAVDEGLAPSSLTAILAARRSVSPAATWVAAPAPAPSGPDTSPIPPTNALISLFESKMAGHAPQRPPLRPPAAPAHVVTPLDPHSQPHSVAADDRATTAVEPPALIRMLPSKRGIVLGRADTSTPTPVAHLVAVSAGVSLSRSAKRTLAISATAAAVRRTGLAALPVTAAPASPSAAVGRRSSSADGRGTIHPPPHSPRSKIISPTAGPDAGSVSASTSASSLVPHHSKNTTLAIPRQLSPRLSPPPTLTVAHVDAVPHSRSHHSSTPGSAPLPHDDRAGHLVKSIHSPAPPFPPLSWSRRQSSPYMTTVTPSLPLHSLTNAIVAGSLAFGRLTPSNTGGGGGAGPMGGGGNGGGLGSSLAAATAGQTGHESGPPQSQPARYQSPRLLTTLRQPASLSDGDSEKQRPGRKPLHRRHGYHEGARKRWRDTVTVRERRRYEALWASNRGLLLPADDADRVVNLVVRDVWRRSRLPADELAEVWELVDISARDSLSRQEFVVGMWVIDQRLRGRKIPARVSESVWDSAGGVAITWPRAGVRSR